MRIGVLHPGEMGSSVGDALIQSGHEVFWVSASRSEETRSRALLWNEKSDLESLVDEVEAIISVCPPSQALAVAENVVSSDFAGIFVDANAIAPQTASAILRLFEGRYVDGGLIGPPARRAGSTRLYLSGERAETVKLWFSDGLLDARVISTDRGLQASSLKMAYAGYTKASSALLMLINAFAEDLGVRDELRNEWAISLPELDARSKKTATSTAAKAWRFVGEMQEIAKSMHASQLPPGFHESAASIYEMMASLKHEQKVDIEHVVASILNNRPHS